MSDRPKQTNICRTVKGLTLRVLSSCVGEALTSTVCVKFKSFHCRQNQQVDRCSFEVVSLFSDHNACKIVAAGLLNTLPFVNIRIVFGLFIHVRL